MTPADRDRLARLERLASWLDARFRIPGTGIRFGLDSVIGLIPGVGDGAGLAASAFILVSAWQLGVPPGKLARMAANVGLDFLVGGVPVLGDLFDVAFKANQRNIAILREHLARR